SEEDSFHSEGREAELERPPPVRRALEGDRLVERVAPRDPPRLQAFELKRCAPREDGEDHLEPRPTLGATIEPDRVRGLHLSGVLDDRRPPERRDWGGRSGGAGGPRVEGGQRPPRLRTVEAPGQALDVRGRGANGEAE